MNYPLISEYVEAINLAEDNLEQLSFLRPVLDSDGRPVMSSGNFAVVFKMKDERDGKFYALKCFIKDQNGRNEAYKQIADELEFVSSEFIIPIKFYEKELFVNTSNGDETEFPVLLMDWVEGVTLDKYVRNHLHDQYSLQLISYQFCRVAAWLMAQPFAHGDLKPDNILVKDDVSLVLVDYDGMFVPAMKGQKAREVGSPDYRHPARTIDDFNESIDDFSMATIAMQLYAIALCPGMLTATAGDTLLLGEKDYLDLENSEVMTKLFSQVGNPEFEKLLAIFLLAHSEMSLSKLSFRIFNISKPTKPAVTRLSTKVLDEDIVNGITDEYGAVYSPDGKRLLKGVNSASYFIKPGTRVICDLAFHDCNSLTSITIPDTITAIGTLAFSGCCDLTSVSIPYLVTQIAVGAFMGCKSLTRIYIRDAVADIGPLAFNGCESLTSINLPDSVTNIGTHAFLLCKSLTNIKIPNSVRHIGYGAFSNCNSLICINIPDSVTQIGEGAFCFSHGLTSINISDSVTYIGEDACQGCNSLTCVNIPSSVTHIGARAFSKCNSLTSMKVNGLNKTYDSRESCNAIIHTVSNSLVAGCKNTIIPNSITAIGGWAFFGCSGLTSINIPDSVMHIGQCSFKECKSLTSINIPDSVTHIGEEAFKCCTRLRSINIPNSITCIGDSIFDGCEDLTSIIIPNRSKQRFQNLLSDYCDILIEKDDWEHLKSTEVKDEDIWDGIKDESGATYSNDWNRLLHVPENISSLVIKQGTRVIGDRAFSLFMGREDITSIIIPNTVTHIGQDAFSGCRRLTSILIPNSVTDIHNRAFSWCARLSSITIPKSVTFIGTGVFNACSELKSIKVDDDNQVYDSRGNCNAVIHTKTNTLIAGCSITKIPNSILHIGDQAFWECHGLSSIVIPNSVTSIDKEAFYECDRLTNISIPDSVTYIGSNAFEGCKGLSSIFIPDSVTYIENNAFYGCDGLTSIKVSINNPTYDSRENCNAIIHTASNTLVRGCNNTLIPDSVTHIGDTAFYGYNNLTSITIPNSVTSIGDRAFDSCSGISSIALPESVTHIGNEAFQFCINIKSLFIPETIIHIGHYAFLGCDSLTSIKVSKNNPIYDSRDNCNAIIHTKTNTLITGCSNTTIPNSITQIGDSALYGNDGLTNISIPNSVTQIGDCAFAECGNLTNIAIPNSVTHIGDGAFDDCDSLMSITIPKGSTNRFKQLITNESIHKLLVEK